MASTGLAANQFATLVHPAASVSSRDRLMARFLTLGISSRCGIEYAQEEFAYSGLPRRDLPYSEAVRDSVILLPNYAEMLDDNVNFVLDTMTS